MSGENGEKSGFARIQQISRELTIQRKWEEALAMEDELPSDNEEVIVLEDELPSDDEAVAEELAEIFDGEGEGDDVLLLTDEVPEEQPADDVQRETDDLFGASVDVETIKGRSEGSDFAGDDQLEDDDFIEGDPGPDHGKSAAAADDDMDRIDDSFGDDDPIDDVTDDDFEPFDDPPEDEGPVTYDLDEGDYDAKIVKRSYPQTKTAMWMLLSVLAGFSLIFVAAVIYLRGASEYGSQSLGMVGIVVSIQGMLALFMTTLKNKSVRRLFKIVAIAFFVGVMIMVTYNVKYILIWMDWPLSWYYAGFDKTIVMLPLMFGFPLLQTVLICRSKVKI